METEMRLWADWESTQHCSVQDRGRGTLLFVAQKCFSQSSLSCTREWCCHQSYCTKLSETSPKGTQIHRTSNPTANNQVMGMWTSYCTTFSWLSSQFATLLPSSKYMRLLLERKTAILGLFVWGIYHFPLTTPFFGSTGQPENMLSILIKIISLSWWNHWTGFPWAVLPLPIPQVLLWNPVSAVPSSLRLSHSACPPVPLPPGTVTAPISTTAWNWPLYLPNFHLRWINRTRLCMLPN